MMKDNISKLKNCYGCGVCTAGCPVGIINMRLNDEGFYIPVIDEEEKCIECGICLNICAFNHQEVVKADGQHSIKAYGCWSADMTHRFESTTGGLGFEISDYIVKQGERVCGVKYNPGDNRAEHVVADNEEMLTELRGTKYIPSFTQAAFKKINKDFRGVVIGLPCQIDSMRRYIRRMRLEDGIILIDLFCYGVPSLNLWKRYLKNLGLNNDGIESIKFRSKKYGWHNSACIEIKSDKREYFEKASDCSFYQLFFSNSCLNKCCYESCKYKRLSSAADIRIGDFWGKQYKDDNQGVNLLLTLSSKGEDIVKDLHDTCEFHEAEVQDAVEGQLKTNVRYRNVRSFILWGLRKGLALNTLANVSRLWNMFASKLTFNRK